MSKALIYTILALGIPMGIVLTIVTFPNIYTSIKLLMIIILFVSLLHFIFKAEEELTKTTTNTKSENKQK